MNKFNKKIKMVIVITSTLLSLLVITFFALPAKEENIINQHDLIIYTPLSNNIYLPIIKEFQERNNILINIKQEDEDIIMDKLKDPDFDGNIILGIHSNSAESNNKYLAKHQALNAVPFVISFNNNLLSYNEQIENYNSLLKPSLKGQIGFLNPNKSTVYKQILNIMAERSNKPELFNELFLSNTKDYFYESIDEINQALEKGKISVAITNKKSAINLSNKDKNINFLDKSNYDCIITYSLALPKSSDNYDNALDFFEFATGSDAAQFISSYLNNDLGGNGYELD